MRLPLLLFALASWPAPAAALDICPSKMGAQSLLAHVVSVISAIPGGFDTDLQRRDQYFVKLGVGLAESARVDRALDVIEHISSPVERALALGRVSAQVAAGGDTGRADLILSKAVDAMALRTAAEQVDTYNKLLDWMSPAGYAEGVRQIDAAHLHASIREVSVDRDDEVRRRTAVLTQSAARLAGQGFVGAALERIHAARELAGRLPGRPSLRATELGRVARLRLRLEGLAGALDSANAIRRPSERALGLLQLAEEVAHTSGADAAQPVLVAARKAVAEATNFVWERDSKSVLLVDVAKRQAKLGAFAASKQTLETAIRLSSAVATQRNEPLEIDLTLLEAFVDLIPSIGPPASGFDALLARALEHFRADGWCGHNPFDSPCSSQLSRLIVAATLGRGTARTRQMIEQFGPPSRDYVELIRSATVELSRRSFSVPARELWSQLEPKERARTPAELIAAEVRAGGTANLGSISQQTSDLVGTVDAVLAELRASDRNQEALALIDDARPVVTESRRSDHRLHAAFMLAAHEAALGRGKRVSADWQANVSTLRTLRSTRRLAEALVGAAIALDRVNEIVEFLNSPHRGNKYEKRHLAGTLIKALREHPRVGLDRSGYSVLAELAEGRDVLELGRLAISRNDFDQAVQVAQQLGSGFGDRLQQEVVVAKAQAGDAKGAAQLWSSVRFRSPIAKAWDAVALAWIRAGDVERARAVLESVNTSGRKLEVAAALVATAYERGLDAAAGTLLEEALRLATAHHSGTEAVGPLLDLAERLIEARRDDQAHALVVRALELLPRNPGVHHDPNRVALDELAATDVTLLVRMGRLDEARKQAELIEKQFTYEQAMKTIMQADLSSGGTQAMSDLQQIFDDPRDQIEVLLNRAMADVRNGEVQSARTHIDRALRSALASGCYEYPFRVLPALARIGREGEVLVWLDHMEAGLADRLGVLNAVATGQLEAGNRVAATTTLGWALELLEGRVPMSAGAGATASSVREFAEAVTVKSQPICSGVLLSFVDARRPEVAPLLDLADTAAALEDPRSVSFLDYGEELASQVARTESREFLLGEVALARARAGWIEQACSRIGELQSEHGRVQQLIDLTLAALASSRE